MESSWRLGMDQLPYTIHVDVCNWAFLQVSSFFIQEISLDQNQMKKVKFSYSLRKIGAMVKKINVAICHCDKL